ncbi:MAG: NAD-dependent epimerase/dehydratase family protein [Chitinophagales bacterium]|nr:NAD-dependent epimerase/dehydratase family protein [Chitinophagales bacterium]
MNLITGANGLVGSYICRYLLLRGEKVRAIKRDHSDLRLLQDIKDNIEWVHGDVTDIISLEDAMSGIEKVYHAAGFISYVKHKQKDLMKVNAEGTTNVVNVALEKGIKKLVHISSIAAIGRKGNGETVDENNQWEADKNTSGYALSKFLGEREVWRGIAEGLNAVILNPSLVSGAGNWNQGSSKLFSTVHKGFQFYTEGVTGYVDVRDVAKISWQLMQSDIRAERFIISAENISYRDYFFMIADALHKKRPSIKANKFLSALAWRADALKYRLTGKEPTVTKQTARIANSVYFFDNTKIKNALQYQFIPIRQTVSESADCFLQYKQTGINSHLDFK